MARRDLSAIASRGELILGLLHPDERAALARGYLRFKVDSPVVVDVAVPARSVPFWIGDQGFRATDLVLENPDTAWKVFRKTFEAGWIGLGVNNLDRIPVAHYVVFVRPRARGNPSTCQPTVTLDPRHEAHWQTALAHPGVSAARDSCRPFKAMPSELAGAVLLQASHAQRHAALLATGRVWKTHVVSTSRPDQVTVAFGADAARELVWTWRTSPEIDATVIRIARAAQGDGRLPSSDGAGATGNDVRIITGESRCIEVPDLLNDPVVRRHRVAVDRLQPNTVYQYSLGDGTLEGWEPWQTVKTGPNRSCDVRFLYLGDAQTGLEGWGRLLRTAYRRHRGLDFIVLAGDLVDRGNERTNWDHFFLRAEGIFDRLPLMPCAGNHEYLDRGPRLYRALFELPRNGPGGIDSDLVYHFECGDACFAVLDSTLASCDADNARRQADWLDDTLEQTRATWKFVIFHHPIYPSHPWRDTPALRKHWVPIFDRHHVDFVLQGHDHAYQRTYPLRAHQRVDNPGNGTIYLIAVSGDKFVDLAPRDYVEVGQSGVSTYQIFEIDSQSNRLTYRASTLDGRIIDELRIDKPKIDQFSEKANAKSAIHTRPERATHTVPSYSQPATGIPNLSSFDENDLDRYSPRVTPAS